MKKDKLERFIIENRNRFDNAEVPPHLWMEIDKVLEEQKRRKGNQLHLLKIAASLAVLLFAGALGGIFINQHYFGKQPQASNSMIQDFEEAEKYYTKQLNVALKEYGKFDTDEQLLLELTYLDAAYQDLKHELYTSGALNNERIIHELIENYRTKLAILEKVLQRLKEQKNSNNSENEKVSI